MGQKSKTVTQADPHPRHLCTLQDIQPVTDFATLLDQPAVQCTQWAWLIPEPIGTAPGLRSSVPGLTSILPGLRSSFLASVPAVFRLCSSGPGHVPAALNSTPALNRVERSWVT